MAKDIGRARNPLPSKASSRMDGRTRARWDRRTTGPARRPKRREVEEMTEEERTALRLRSGWVLTNTSTAELWFNTLNGAVRIPPGKRVVYAEKPTLQMEEKKAQGLLQIRSTKEEYLESVPNAKQVQIMQNVGRSMCGWKIVVHRVHTLSYGEQNTISFDKVWERTDYPSIQEKFEVCHGWVEDFVLLKHEEKLLILFTFNIVDTRQGGRNSLDRAMAGRDWLHQTRPDLMQGLFIGRRFTKRQMGDAFICGPKMDLITGKIDVADDATFYEDEWGEPNKSRTVVLEA
jgi:hypothetical protein